jgi:hypothetical protein
MKKTFVFILVVLIIFFIFTLILNLYSMGSIGIRPRTHGCFGVTLPRAFVHKMLPDARIEFMQFAYYVDEESMGDWPYNYCLGKDIWFGE